MTAGRRASVRLDLEAASASICTLQVALADTDLLSSEELRVVGPAGPVPLEEIVVPGQGRVHRFRA